MRNPIKRGDAGGRGAGWKASVLCMLAQVAAVHAQGPALLLKGPIEAPPEGFKVVSFCACAGEGERVGLAWVVEDRSEEAQGAVDSSASAGTPGRPGSRPQYYLGLAVVGSAGKEWAGSIQVADAWPCAGPGFPGAMDYRDGRWHLLVSLPTRLAMVRFGAGGEVSNHNVLDDRDALFHPPYWLFRQNDGWHVFWMGQHSASTDLPDFMGGNPRQTIEHVLYTEQGAVRRKRVYELSRPWAQQLRIVPVGSRFDAFYIQDSPSRRGSANAGLYHLRDVLGRPDQPARLATGCEPLSVRAMVTSDDEMAVFWQEPRGWAVTHSAKGKWSSPRVLDGTSDWPRGATAGAVVGEEKQVILMGLPETIVAGMPVQNDVFEYITGLGQSWGPTTESRIGVPSVSDPLFGRLLGTVLLPLDQSRFALISRKSDGLYYCFFQMADLLRK